MDTFFLLGIWIGTSLSIDSSIVTLSRFRERLHFWSWTFPIAGFHILFTGLGLFGAMFWLQGSPEQSQLVFGLAALLVFCLCFEWCRDWRGAPIDWGPVALLSRMLHRFDGTMINRWITMIVISLDALLGSPSFAVVGTDWSNGETACVILLIGMTVMGWTSGALWVAQKLRRHQAVASSILLAKLSIGGKLFQLTVIGAFGIASLVTMLGGDVTKIASLIISGFIALIYFLSHNQSLQKREMEELGIE